VPGSIPRGKPTQSKRDSSRKLVGSNGPVACKSAIVPFYLHIFITTLYNLLHVFYKTCNHEDTYVWEVAIGYFRRACDGVLGLPRGSTANADPKLTS